MEKEFVPYEQALELKEILFNEPCLAWYCNNMNMLYSNLYYGNIIGLTCNYPPKPKQLGCYAPTYSQAFRWFRERYDIHSWIINADDNPNVFKPFFRGNDKFIFDQHLIDFYDTYEEAELECLKKLIELVKQR